MIKKLKQCPFCGGEVSLETNTFFYYIRCNRCNLVACFSDKDETEEETIEAWNKRGERNEHINQKYGDAESLL